MDYILKNRSELLEYLLAFADKKERGGVKLQTMTVNAGVTKIWDKEN